MLFQDTYIIWLQRRMPLSDAVFQDGHHHALAGVASPPGPSDVERRRAATGAVPALLRSKEREVRIGWESGISQDSPKAC